MKTGAEKTRLQNVCVPRRATTSNQPRGNVCVTRAEPVTLTSGLPSPNDQVITSFGWTGRSTGETGEAQFRQGRASRSVAGRPSTTSVLFVSICTAYHGKSSANAADERSNTASTARIWLFYHRLRPLQ